MKAKSRVTVKKILNDAPSILISALAATMFTIIQAILIESGVCPEPIVETETAAFLGGGIKAIHSAFFKRGV